MLASLSSDSAAHLLTWSNRIYVAGAVLTLGSAAMVLYEKHSKNQGRALRWGLATEVVVIVAAFISLCGTVGAIGFGNVVSHLKDVDLEAYKTSATLKITEAHEESAKADRAAASANLMAKTAEKSAQEAQGVAERSKLDKARIEQQNLGLQKSLEDERTARLNIERQLAPRSLTTAQQESLRYNIALAGPQVMDVFIYPNDGEALQIAEQIASALPGWTFHTFQPLAGGRVQGIALEYDPREKNAQRRALALATALKSVGLKVFGVFPDLPTPQSALPAYMGDGKPSAPIRLTVGPK